MAANETASPYSPPRQVPAGSIRELLRELRARAAAGPTTDSPATRDPRRRPPTDPASHQRRRLPATDRYAHPDDQDPPLPLRRIAEANPFSPVVSSPMQHSRSNSRSSAGVDHNPRRGGSASLTAPPPAAAAVPNASSGSDEGIRRIRLARINPRRRDHPDPAALEITTTTTTTTTETIITTTTTTTTSTTVQRVAQ